MNRLGVLLLACAAFGSGCSASNYAIYILRNQVLTDGCNVPDGSGTDYRAAGQLDVTDPEPGTNFENPGYFFAAAVANGTVASKVEPNAHLFYLQGADVELRSNGSDASDALIAAMSSRSLDKRTQRFSGSIPPSSTAGVGFFLIDADQTLAMNDVLSTTPVQVIARARIFGSLDNSDFEADPFEYPITVCKGCAVNFIGACPDSTTADPNVGGTCNPLQDGLLDCCSDTAGATVCPPPVMTPGG